MREYQVLFFTATIKDWKKLLKPDKYKQIIMDSLKFLVEKNKIYLYAFVIMPNHIHVLWKIREPNLFHNIKRDFLKFTSQSIKHDLEMNHPLVLEYFKSNRQDRKYQFWQDRSYNTPLYNSKVIEQKIEYIHNNPLSKKWKLVKCPEDYYYSSAKFYLCDDTNWKFITHFREHV